MANKVNSADNEAVRAYWNEHVFDWKIATHDVGSEAFFLELERYRFEKLEYLARCVNFNGYANLNLLDVGCGLGNDTSRFALGGALITGIDISPHAIELSQENFTHRGLTGDFEVMDGENMSFADNSFDVIYCHTVFHFTHSPQKMVDEIQRVLKPGGTAILMTINRHSWLFFLHKLLKLEIDYLDSPVFKPFSYGEYADMLSVFDQVDIVVERFPVPTEVHRGLKAWVYNKLFVGFYNALPKYVTRKTGYHFLAFVKKKRR